MFSRLTGLPVRFYVAASGPTEAWQQFPAPDRDTAVDDAHRLCQEALKAGRDTVVLIADAKTRQVEEYMVTFADDPDADPYWSHRECAPVELEEAKAKKWDIAPTEVVGNYEAREVEQLLGPS